MPFWYEIFLSILQGATEFLPVSSSGHLALFQIFSNKYKEPPILFDLFLHFATLGAIIVYYKKKIKSYFNFKKISYLFFGTVGTAMVAFPLKALAEKAFSSPFVISIFLIITGLIIFFANKIKEKNDELNLKKAILIGIFQGFAIFPGLSRSGVTISLGLFLGLKASTACEFSFILSIPSILGANMIEFYKNFNSSDKVNLIGLIIPFFITFITGLVFLNFTNKIFIKKRLIPFSYYCIILGAVMIGVYLYGKSI